MLLLAGFMTLATVEVLQLAALVLFSPRKVITAAEQVLATKSARPKIKCKNGRTISMLPCLDDPKRARVYGLSAPYAIRITRPILGRESSADSRPGDCRGFLRSVTASEKAAGRRSGTVRGILCNTCIPVYTPLFKQLATSRPQLRRNFPKARLRCDNQ